MKLLGLLLVLGTLGVACRSVDAQQPPATQPAAGQPAGGQAAGERPVNFRFITVDRQAGEVRVEAEVIDVQMPLEFLAVSQGGPDHESVLRTAARPSEIHAALLMLGIEAGSPIRYSEAADRWLPPVGPPLQIFVEWEGAARMPATRVMKRIEGQGTMPARTWVFAGSEILDDGRYAADITGQLVSIVNFDYSVIDVPALASNANETLEWEANKAVLPEPGTLVTLVLKPVAGQGGDDAAAAEPQEDANEPLDVNLLTVRADGTTLLNRKPLSMNELQDQLAQMQARRPVNLRVAVDTEVPFTTVQQVLAAAEAAGVENLDLIVGGTRQDAEAGPNLPGPQGQRQLPAVNLEALRNQWEQAVLPQAQELRQAAQTHYRVIQQLRDQQQALIDEADKIQRLIDELESQYQELATPRPAPRD